jgi:hypothetical protein
MNATNFAQTIISTGREEEYMAFLKESGELSEDEHSAELRRVNNVNYTMYVLEVKRYDLNAKHLTTCIMTVTAWNRASAELKVYTYLMQNKMYAGTIIKLAEWPNSDNVPVNIQYEYK